MELESRLTKSFYLAIESESPIIQYSYPGFDNEPVNKLHFLSDAGLGFPDYEGLKAGRAVSGFKCIVGILICGKYNRKPSILWDLSSNRRFIFPMIELNSKDENYFNNTVIRGMESLGLGDLICDFLIHGYLINQNRIIAIFSVVVDTFRKKGMKISIIHSGMEFLTHLYRIQTYEDTLKEIQEQPNRFNSQSALMVYITKEKKLR